MALLVSGLASATARAVHAASPCEASTSLAASTICARLTRWLLLTTAASITASCQSWDMRPKFRTRVPTRGGPVPPFVFMDLRTTDRDRSRSFYGDLFG